MTAFLMTGDAETRLHDLADQSVHCCVTSPPYYGLRDYSNDGQIGHEETPKAYVNKLVGVLREVRRVLRDDGSLWVVVGDSYMPENRGENAKPRAHESYARYGQGNHFSADLPTVKAKQIAVSKAGIKRKDLIGVPWMLAFALRDDGWYLREEIVWQKLSCMPESVRDRCTRQHETVFHLTKSERYFHDWFAIAEPAAGMTEHDLTGQGYDAPGQSIQTGTRQKRPHGSGNGYKRSSRLSYLDDNGARGSDTPYTPCAIRNARSVWTINPEPFDSQMCLSCRTYFRGADYKRLLKDDKNRRTCSSCGTNDMWSSHFAVFPTRLVSRIVRCSTPDGGCCPSCETPLERLVENGEPDEVWMKASGADANGRYAGSSRDGGDVAGAQDASATKVRILAGMTSKRTAGWKRTCGCADDVLRAPVRATVIDPFSGAGTTALCAIRLGRRSIGIDINRDYHDMAASRLRDNTTKCLDGNGDRIDFVIPSVNVG